MFNILIDIFVGFQAFLAVKGKVMPHQALSKKKTIVLLCFWWAYGSCIALLCMLTPHKKRPAFSVAN